MTESQIRTANDAYAAMTKAWKSGDYAEAFDRADVLLNWLDAGGAAPTAVHDPRTWITAVWRFYHPDGPVAKPDGAGYHPHRTTVRTGPYCTTCGGLLARLGSYGGYVHYRDTDDTHAPVAPIPGTA